MRAFRVLLNMSASIFVLCVVSLSVDALHSLSWTGTRATRLSIGPTQGTSVGDAHFKVARTLSACSSRESLVADSSHFTMGRTLCTGSPLETLADDRS